MARVLIQKRYGHDQTSESSEWIINHNLDVDHPVVDVWIYDSTTKNYINSDAYSVTVTNSNIVSIKFTSSNKPTGRALIS